VGTDGGGNVYTICTFPARRRRSRPEGFYHITGSLWRQASITLKNEFNTFGPCLWGSCFSLLLFSVSTPPPEHFMKNELRGTFGRARDGENDRVYGRANEEKKFPLLNRYYAAFGWVLVVVVVAVFSRLDAETISASETVFGEQNTRRDTNGTDGGGR